MNTTATAQPTANQVRRQVCTLLGWTYDQYAEFIYERGIAYLHWYLPALEEQRNKLERSKLYWNWWKNSWMLRDEVFAYNLTVFPLKLANMERIYRETHNSRELLLEGLQPPKCVTQYLFFEPKLKEVVYE